jgi:16S rRNA (guanine527-N7)-methyltransferase
LSKSPGRDQAAAIDPGELRALLDAGLAAMGGESAALDAASRDTLVEYIGLLTRWNRAFNLTAVRDPRAMVPRHLLDSLAVLPWVTRGPVLDLGTGAGLPGIPLAVVRPGLAFTLLDSNGKKTRFVRQAVLELGLANVEVVQSRLEAYRPPHKFATIVARALAALPQLIAGARPLAGADGRLLALKGVLSGDERAALERAQAAALSGDGAHVGTPGEMGDPSTVSRPATGPQGDALAKRDAGSAFCHPLSVPGIDGERTLIEVPLGSSTYG